MLDVGTHKSLDNAPCAPMFTEVCKQNRPSQANALTHAFTEMATSIASASSQQSKPSTPTKNLP